MSYSARAVKLSLLLTIILISIAFKEPDVMSDTTSTMNNFPNSYGNSRSLLFVVAPSKAFFRLDSCVSKHIAD
jgi:hypothetical protein